MLVDTEASVQELRQQTKGGVHSPSFDSGERYASPPPRLRSSGDSKQANCLSGSESITAIDVVGSQRSQRATFTRITRNLPDLQGAHISAM